MSLTRRRSNTKAAPKANTSVIIDLDSDDDLPVAPSVKKQPTDAEEDEHRTSEDDLPTPPLKKRTSGAKKTPPTSHGSSTIPILPDAADDSDDEPPLRRAATIAVSQVRSAKAAPVNKVRKPKALPGSFDQELEDLLADQDNEHTATPAMSEDKPSLEAPHDSELDELEVELSPVKTSSFSASTRPVRQEHVPETKPAVQIKSTPSKLPSASNSGAKSEIKSSSSSIFRSKHYINVDLVASTSTLEEMEDLRSKVDRSSQQSNKRTLRLSLAEEFESSDSGSDDDLEFLTMPSKKKHCGPGRKPSAVKPEKKKKAPSQASHSTSQANLSDDDDIHLLPVTDEDGSSAGKNGSSSKMDLDVDDDGIEATVVKKGNSSGALGKNGRQDAKASGAKALSRSSIDRTTSNNEDELLDAILGPNRRAAAASGSGGYVQAGVYVPGKSYAQYAAEVYNTPSARNIQQAAASAHQLLALSRMRGDAGIEEAAAMRRSAQSLLAASAPIKVKLKMGSKVVETVARRQDTAANLITRWTNENLLPSLPPNQTYFLKFDQLPLDPTDTVDSRFIGGGDEIELCGRRADGTEDVHAFDDDLFAFEAEAPVDVNRIRLKVRHPDGTVAKYTIDRDAPLSKIAERVAEKLKVKTVRLQFDDEFLDLDVTPNEHGELEEDDMLDASIPKK